jgi:hypothetical protein
MFKLSMWSFCLTSCQWHAWLEFVAVALRSPFYLWALSHTCISGFYIILLMFYILFLPVIFLYFYTCLCYTCVNLTRLLFCCVAVVPRLWSVSQYWFVLYPCPMSFPVCYPVMPASAKFWNVALLRSYLLVLSIPPHLGRCVHYDN